MDAIPNATQEEVSQFPAHLKELQNWLLAQGKSETLVQQTSRNLHSLFQDDSKSISGMATQTYFDLVKVSPKNVSRHNQRSAAVKHLMRFWESRGGRASQPSSGGDQQIGTPAAGTAGTPAQSTPAQGTDGAAATTPTPQPVVKAKAKSSAKRKKSEAKENTENKKKKKESDGRTSQPLATLPSAHGFSEAVEQARALDETEAAEALCLLGRDPAKRNASINGVYVNRGKQFHGRDSFVKDGDEPEIARLLFYSATKGAWKVSNKLDDSKSGFAFAKAEDKGKALPTEPSNCLAWRVCDGKSEGYNKDRTVRCLATSSLLKAAEIASAMGEESEGEMGSGSSSCQQGGSSDAEGSSSSSSSSASGSGSGGGSGSGAANADAAAAE